MPIDLGVDIGNKDKNCFEIFFNASENLLIETVKMNNYHSSVIRFSEEYLLLK